MGFDLTQVLAFQLLEMVQVYKLGPLNPPLVNASRTYFDATDDGYRSFYFTGYAGGSTRETQSGRGDGETAYGSYKPDLPRHNSYSGPSLFVRGCHKPSKSTFHVSLQVSICPVVHYGGVNAFM